MGPGTPMRSLSFALAICVAWMVVSTARADVPNTRWRAYIASRFGVHNPCLQPKQGGR